MKKYWLVCFLVQLTAFVGRAQAYVGLQAGISGNYLQTNISNRASTIINSQLGYSIGILFQYNLNNWLSIKALPNITKKNYSIRRTDSLLGVYAQNNNTYLQLPIMAQLAYGKQLLQVTGGAGAYVGYWLTGRQKGNTPNIFAVSTGANGSENFQLSNYNEKYVFNSQRDNRLEFGWVANIGLQYKLSNKYFVFADGMYYQSLTDQQRKYMVNQIPQYNQTFTFSVGCLRPIK